MVAFWTPPYSLLGEYDAYMDIIYSVSVVVVSLDPHQHKTIESIDAEITDPVLRQYFTITTNIQNGKPTVYSRATATIIGKVPLDVFDDMYTVTEQPGSTFVSVDALVSDGSTVSKVYEIKHHQNFDKRRGWAV